MEFKKIHFVNKSGEKLAARLDFPVDSKPGAFVLFAHCFTCTKIDKIERKITLSGPLDAAQKQRLLEIADRCPVHRTLHSEIKVETFLAD